MPLHASFDMKFFFSHDVLSILFVLGRYMPEECAFICVNLFTIRARVLDTLVHRLYMGFQVVSVGKLLVTYVTRVFGTLVN